MSAFQVADLSIRSQVLEGRHSFNALTVMENLRLGASVRQHRSTARQIISRRMAYV